MERTRTDLGVPGPAPAVSEGPANEERSTIANRPVISRRAVIGGGIVGFGGLLLFPSQLLAKGAAPNDSFVILLKGLYQPVVHGPNLGLSTVDLTMVRLDDVDLSVSGTPGNQNHNKSIGNFYVQFDGDLCAYHVPADRSRCASWKRLRLR